MNDLMREDNDRTALWGWIAVGAVLFMAVAGLVYLYFTNPPTTLDAHLCPVDTGPTATTVLLLDTSDPLSPKHRAELERLVKELKGAGSDTAMEVAPGEALVVYALDGGGKETEPQVDVCNPGDNPDEWTFKKDLTRGKMFAARNWQRFENRVYELLPAVGGREQPRSPILELLSVVVPRHAPSQRERGLDGQDPLHLIVFSDLLQHSDTLSHYGPYPDADEMKHIHRELLTDLTGVDVSLFRLERHRYAKWQTKDHYYWWTQMVLGLGGRIRWQQSL